MVKKIVAFDKGYMAFVSTDALFVAINLSPVYFFVPNSVGWLKTAKHK